MKRGQASVEFLTTYGWAIFATLIMVGALTYLDVFETDRFLTESCELGPKMQCLESTVDESGQFQINIRNNHPVDVNISRMTVSYFGEETTKTFSPEADIDRGSNEILSMNVPSSELYADTKVDMDLHVRFGRENGKNKYNLTGSTVVRVTE